MPFKPKAESRTVTVSDGSRRCHAHDLALGMGDSYMWLLQPPYAIIAWYRCLAETILRLRRGSL